VNVISSSAASCFESPISYLATVVSSDGGRTVAMIHCTAVVRGLNRGLL
jgi:hypothetical protein